MKIKMSIFRRIFEWFLMVFGIIVILFAFYLWVDHNMKTQMRGTVANMSAQELMALSNK